MSGLATLFYIWEGYWVGLEASCTSCPIGMLWDNCYIAVTYHQCVTVEEYHKEAVFISLTFFSMKGYTSTQVCSIAYNISDTM